jgi:hypothetical protein
MTLKTIACSLLVSSLFGIVACGAVDSDPVAQDEPGADAAPRIEPALIQAAMRAEFFPNGRVCYEAVLAGDADAGGKVALRFVIRDGAAEEIGVDVVEGTLQGEDFIDCMADALAEVSFPVADGDVTVTYPIVFSKD